MTDEERALAAQNGDRAAMQALMEKYKNAVRSTARRYFLEGGDAEDLVQEGMIGLYLAVSDYKAGGMSFKTFAYLCIDRRIVSAVRSAARKKHLPLNTGVPFPGEGERGELAAAGDPEAELISGEEAEEFWRSVRGALTENEYEALSLYVQGLRIADIAERRGISLKSADNAVQRAKKKVSALLKSR